MLTRKVTLAAPSGLHARPAGDLVKLVRSLAPCKISIATESKSVNAASVLSLLSLGAKSGTELTVGADGGDEAAALDAVVGFIAAID